VDRIGALKNALDSRDVDSIESTTLKLSNALKQESANEPNVASIAQAEHLKTTKEEGHATAGAAQDAAVVPGSASAQVPAAQTSPSQPENLSCADYPIAKKPSILLSFHNRIVEFKTIKDYKGMKTAIAQASRDLARLSGECWNYYVFPPDVWALAGELDAASKVANRLEGEAKTDEHQRQQDAYTENFNKQASEYKACIARLNPDEACTNPNASTDDLVSQRNYAQTFRYENCLEKSHGNQACSELAQQEQKTGKMANWSSIKAAPDTSKLVNISIMFTIYQIVQTCASNNTIYNQTQADIIKAVVLQKSKESGITREQSDSIWHLVNGVHITTNDCETVHTNIDALLPGVFADVEDNPFK
jgi:hypothetical protein